MNEIQAAIASIPKTKKIISLCIMLGSLFGVFFVGFHFNLFNSKIDFIQKPATFLFFGFILSGLLGIFYLFQPMKSAIKQTIIVAVVFCALYLIGKLARGEL